MKTTLGFFLVIAVSLIAVRSAKSADIIYAPVTLSAVTNENLRDALSLAAPNYDALDRASQITVYDQVISTYSQTQNVFYPDPLYADRVDAYDSFVPGAVFEPYHRYYRDEPRHGYGGRLNPGPQRFEGPGFEGRHGFNRPMSQHPGPMFGDGMRDMRGSPHGGDTRR